MKKKLTFIVNPVSGKGKQKNFEQKLIHHLDHDQYKYDIFYTTHKAHAIELASNAVKDSEIIVAVGGDGTVNEVAKVLFGTNLLLGVIPVGSGNGLARHLGIPINIDRAIKTINRLNTNYLDTATLNGKFFITTAGCGFDAHIAALFEKSIKRGFMTYARLVLKEFSSYKTLNYKITIDNIEYKRNVFLVTVANCSQFGNNAFISPLACSNDGILDITLLKSFPITAAPGLVYRLFMKKLHKSKYVELLKGRKVEIEHSSESAHIDGEVINPGNKISIDINPKSLKIIVP